jgi:hypothetical protein
VTANEEMEGKGGVHGASGRIDEIITLFVEHGPENL